MTSSNSLSARNARGKSTPSASTVFNALGLVAGSVTALAGILIAGDPLLFFAGLAGAFFCVDPLRRQS